MKPRLYIAGASKEIERAERAMSWAREDGFEISFDWTAHFKNSPTGDATLSPERRLTAAREDTLGVLDALVFWMLVPDKGIYTNGSFSELGIAAVLRGFGLGLAHPDTPANHAYARSEFKDHEPYIFCSGSTQRQDSIWMEYGEVIERPSCLEADTAVRETLKERFLSR